MVVRRLQSRQEEALTFLALVKDRRARVVKAHFVSIREYLFAASMDTFLGHFDGDEKSRGTADAEKGGRLELRARWLSVLQSKGKGHDYSRCPFVDDRGGRGVGETV